MKEVQKKDIKIEVEEKRIDWFKEFEDLKNNKIVQTTIMICMQLIKRRKNEKNN